MTDISKALRFVRGALDSTRIVPALENFAIKDERIQGCNGMLTLCAPIAIPLNVCVNAARFVRSIAACGSDAIDLTMAKGSKHLLVRSGKFHASVPTAPSIDSFPWVEPSGEPIDVPETLLAQLAALRPFVSTDATRSWSMGVRIEEACAYATNNVLCAEAALKTGAPRAFTVPVQTIDELLRIGIPPKRILLDDKSVSFLYARQWWLRSALLSDDWPDMHALMQKINGSKPARISDDFRKAFQRLLPFMQNAYSPVYVHNNTLTTSPDAADAVTVEGIDVPHRVAVVASMLRIVLSDATHIDWSRFPAPLPFVGKQLRGLLATYATREEVQQAEKHNEKQRATPRKTSKR